jgi:hypothetical protein
MLAKIILVNILLIGPYFYDNLIFLNIPSKIEQHQVEFNLNKEDIRYVRYFFLKTKYPNLATLPKVPARKNVDKFFSILRNQESKNWTRAYLYLLSIVPESFVEEEIGC